MLTLQSVRMGLLRAMVLCLPFGAGLLYTHIVEADIIYAVDVVLFGLYGLWIIESKGFSRGNIVYNSFASAAILKIFWSTLSILPAISQKRGGIGVFMVVKAFLLYFWLINHIKSRRTVDTVVNLLMIGLLLQGIVGVLQYSTGKSLGLGFLGERQMSFHKTLSRARGTLGYPNQFGAFIAMIIPLAFSLFVFTQKSFRKTFYGITALFSLLALMLSFSRSAWAGLLVGTACFVGILTSKRLLNVRFVIATGIVLFGLAALVFAFWDLILLRFETGSDPKYRIKMIEVAIPMVRDNPFLGVGLFNYEFHSMGEFRFWHPVHNDYFRLAAETGLPGLFLFLAIIFLSVRQGVRMLKCKDRFLFATAAGSLCGMIALLVAVNFGPEYQNYRVKLLFWLLAALLFAMPRVVAHAETVRKVREQHLLHTRRVLKTR